MSTLNVPGFVRAKVCEDIQLRVAALRTERQAVFELIYRSYLRAGLCTKNDCGMRATPYQLLPSTDIVLAELRGQVISTVSLVRDGELGMPMESLYPDEVAARRTAGIRLAEVSCLADRRQGMARFFGLLCELSQIVAQLANKTGIEELVIVVNPRHAPLYLRYLGFEQIGEERVYDAVEGFPAVPLSLNFAKAKTGKPKCWSTLFGDPVPDEVLQSCPITAEDRDYFVSLLEPTDPRRESPSQPAATFGNLESDERVLCA